MTSLAAALLAALLLPSSAAAEVRIGPAEISVSSGDAAAVVQRDPFSVTYVSGGRRPALRGAEGTPGASALVPPVPRSQFVTQGPAPPTLYAPLTFLVGETSVQTTPGGQWVGDARSRSPRAAPSTARPRSRASNDQAAERGWCSRRRIPTGRKMLVWTCDPGL